MLNRDAAVNEYAALNEISVYGNFDIIFAHVSCLMSPRGSFIYICHPTRRVLCSTCLHAWYSTSTYRHAWYFTQCPCSSDVDWCF